MPAPWKESYDKPGQHAKKQRHHFANEGPYSQSCGFSSSHVCCESWTTKKGWAPHNWCFWIVVLKKTLESSLDCKEIKPVNPKGNQPWMFIGRNNEGPILWLSDGKNYSLEKTLMLGKIEGKRRKGWPEAFLSFIISHSVGDAIHLILCHPVLNNDINPFFIIFQ